MNVVVKCVGLRITFQVRMAFFVTGEGDLRDLPLLSRRKRKMCIKTAYGGQNPEDQEFKVISAAE